MSLSSSPRARRSGFLAGATLLAVTACTVSASAENPSVLRIGNPAQGSAVNRVAPFGGGALFAVPAGTSATVYTSDGTVAGTKAFVTIPGSGNTLGSLEHAGGDDAARWLVDPAQRLWMTGGSFATTALVGPAPGKALGGGSVLPTGVLVYGLDLGGSGTPPIGYGRSDGSKAGTHVIAGATGRSDAASFVHAGEVHFLTPSGDLRKTDGTLVTTVATPGAGATGALACGNVVYVGSTTELRAVGAAGALTQLASVRVGRMACAGTRLVFQGSTTGTGSELWASDGTPQGTSMIREIAAGTAGGVPFQTYAWKSSPRVVFVGEDEAGAEPWITDGTTNGTARLGDYAPGATTSYPEVLGRVGTSIYFTAIGGGGFRVLHAIADGTTSPQEVTSTNVGSLSGFTAVVSGTKIFGSTSSGALWTFDTSKPVDAGDGQPEDVAAQTAPVASTAPSAPDAGASSSSGSSGASSGASSGSSGASSGGEPVGSTSSSGASGSSGDAAPGDAADAGGCSVVAPARDAHVGVAAGLLVGLAALVRARRRVRSR